MSGPLTSTALNLVSNGVASRLVFYQYEIPFSNIQYTKLIISGQFRSGVFKLFATKLIMTETEFILDGITFSQFATFDNNLATFATSRDDWETEIVEKAKGVDLNDSERYSDENEDSDEDQNERSDKVISMTEAGVCRGSFGGAPQMNPYTYIPISHCFSRNYQFD